MQKVLKLTAKYNRLEDGGEVPLFDHGSCIPFFVLEDEPLIMMMALDILEKRVHRTFPAVMQWKLHRYQEHPDIGLLFTISICQDPWMD